MTHALIIPAALADDPLRNQAFNRLVQGVDFSDEGGQAAEVVLELSAWDDGASAWAEWALEAIYPGEEFELWTADQSVCFGLFEVDSVERSYDAESTGTVIVYAYNGMRRLVKHEQSRIYEGYRNDAEWLPLLAEEHGLATDVDARELQSFKGDRFKEVGETDLAFINVIAMAHGLGLPWVRYDPTTGRETLVMRALDGYRNRGLDSLNLRVTAEGGDVDLAAFSTLWDPGDMPSGVEVIGWDPVVNKPYRVTVQATPKGPQSLGKDYEDIQRADRRKVAPGRRGGDSRGVVIHVLGEGREVVDTSVVYSIRTGKRRRRIRAKRQYREIITTAFQEGVKDAEAYALRWLQDRMEAYYTCSGALVPNLPGAERVTVSQVHRVSGAMTDDNGWYIITGCSHGWGSDGHVVVFQGQRLLLDVVQPLSGSSLA